MFRIGFGNDIHRLVEDKPLILGGVKIKSQLGAVGHSDADVLLHAITDFWSRSRSRHRLAFLRKDEHEKCDSFVF